VGILGEQYYLFKQHMAIGVTNTSLFGVSQTAADRELTVVEEGLYCLLSTDSVILDMMLFLL